MHLRYPFFLKKKEVSNVTLDTDNNAQIYITLDCLKSHDTLLAYVLE